MDNSAIVVAATAVLALAVGLAAAWLLQARLAQGAVSNAKQETEQLRASARKEAERLKQDTLVSARAEALAVKERIEAQASSRITEAQKAEKEQRSRDQSLRDRDKSLKKREQGLEDRERSYSAKEKELANRESELERLHREENERLERVSGLTVEEAKRQLLNNFRSETRYEAAAMIKEIKDEAQKNAETDAKKIMSLAVERLASEFSAERNVTMFPLTTPTLKGRIIGHEGKNIKAFEKSTGIQLVVDESPEVVTLSGFNPVKREIARRTLEKLLKDGNINPQRIEELTAKSTRAVDETMLRAGQETVKELGIKNIHPEIVKLLGRLKYRTSYSQNVLEHVKEVAYLTGIMAAELGLDQKLAKRAGLLHDIGKAIDYEREGTHPEIGEEIGRRYGEHEIVVNAIASHHDDCEAISPISVLVAAAAALSGARPGARRKTLQDYVKRVEKLESLAMSMDGVEQSYAIQAGRELRVICHHQKIDDAHASLLASDLAKRIQAEMDYPGRIKVTVIRETRAIEYAR
jgi:ribonuclease Y